ncbi:hypothetical protein GCM10028772_14430 [Nocardioides ultimimeridianus]
MIWGAFAVAAVVAQIQVNDRFDLWPHGLDSWRNWFTILTFAGAALGVPALVLGALGLRSRLALHLAALLALASTVVTLVWMTIDVTKFDLTWSQIASRYRRNILWQGTPPPGFARWWFLVNDVMLPLGVLALLVWLVVLATGAGRRAPGSGLGYAYVAAPQADYRYVVAPDAPATPAEHGSTPEREVPPVTEPRDVPAPRGSTAEFAPAEVAPVEHAPVEHASEDEPSDQAAEAEPQETAPEPAADDATDIPDVATVRAAADTRPADDERVWFVTVQGTDHGPYSRTQLQGYADEGRLHAGTVTHLAGGEDQALADVLA